VPQIRIVAKPYIWVIILKKCPYFLYFVLIIKKNYHFIIRLCIAMNIVIDFLQYQKYLLIRQIKGAKTEIFDPVRRKYLILQQEELVRQLVLQYLHYGCKIPFRQMRSEFGIKVNSLQKRCDIVIFDNQIQPRLVIECKANNISITQAVFDQVARYNLRLRVPFLMVTNGMTTYCCKVFLETFDQDMTQNPLLMEEDNFEPHRYFEFLEKMPTFDELTAGY
jgi:hypothetical protein